MRDERNRPAKNPGGMRCDCCGEFFIGEEWHEFCGICIQQVADEIADAQELGSVTRALPETKKTL